MVHLAGGPRHGGLLTPVPSPRSSSPPTQNPSFFCPSTIECSVEFCRRRRGGEEDDYVEYVSSYTGQGTLVKECVASSKNTLVQV